MISIRACIVQLTSIVGVGLLESLIDLDWWHELSLGEERVDLLHKFESCVLLVEDKRIDVIDNNRNLSSLEEKLEKLPVVLLLLIVLSIVEAVHLDFLREVS